jgi:hypothetical protein
MESTSKYPYFIIDGLVFILLNALGIWVVIHRHISIPSVSWLQLALGGLAVYRIAQIIANEHITEPLRAPFVSQEESKGKTIERPKRLGFKGAMGSLIYCPSCVGIWVSMVLVYAWLLWPRVVMVIVFIFFFSAIERIITTGLDLWKVKIHQRKE